MICCDKCENWYHGACIGIPPKEGAKIDKFICDDCQKKGLGKITYKVTRNNARDKRKSLAEMRAKEEAKKKEDAEVKKKKEEELAKKEDDEKKKKEDAVLNERKVVVTRLVECLNMPLEESKASKVTLTPELAAEGIEAAMYDFFKGQVKSKDYLQRLRTLLFNLKDEKNKLLRYRVLKNKIKPEKLITMTSKELANEEMANYYKQREQVSLKNVMKNENDMPMIVKTHKGEVKIGVDEGETSFVDQNSGENVGAITNSGTVITKEDIKEEIMRDRTPSPPPIMESQTDSPNNQTISTPTPTPPVVQNFIKEDIEPDGIAKYIKEIEEMQKKKS